MSRWNVIYPAVTHEQSCSGDEWTKWACTCWLTLGFHGKWTLFLKDSSAHWPQPRQPRGTAAAAVVPPRTDSNMCKSEDPGAISFSFHCAWPGRKEGTHGGAPQSHHQVVVGLHGGGGALHCDDGGGGPDRVRCRRRLVAHEGARSARACRAGAALRCSNQKSV